MEDCSGCGLSGWGWQDNGWGVGVRGPLIYFAGNGVQRLRIQTREDGLSIDLLVLSPDRYLTASPGALKNDNTILIRPERDVHNSVASGFSRNAMAVASPRNASRILPAEAGSHTG